MVARTALVIVAGQIQELPVGDTLSGASGYTTEEAQDAVGSILVDSSEIDFTYNDGTPSITASIVSGSIDESKLDTSVNASLDLADSSTQPGDNISTLTNDSGFITSSSLPTTEQIEDIAGALVANVTGTHTGIAITYQDATGDMDFVVDHDAASNFVSNEHINHTSVTLTAGAGLTGGGDISANRTFTVGAGTGITVNADDVALSAGTQASLALANSALQPSAIGSTIQAYDADLTTWAGVTSSANGRSLVSAANYAAMRTLLDLEAGTDFYSISAANAAFQAGDPTLTAFAALTIAANSLTIGTGVDAFSQVTFAANTFPARASTGSLSAKTITDFALNILDDADASAVRTTLGLAIGSNVQAYDSDLNTIAGLTATTDNFIVSVASAWASRTPAQVRTTLGIGSAGLVATDLANLNESTIEAAIDTLANLTSIQGRTITLADAGADAIFGWDDSANAYKNLSAADVRTALALVVGTNVQAYDADLAALAGLTSAANKVPYFTGAGTAGVLDFKDEDNMVSDSATAVPSQQSVKAYVDANAGGGMVLGNNVASTSGTSIDLTGFPADTTQIIIGLRGVSTNGAVALLIQLGDSGGFENTGYGSGGGSITGTSPNSTAYSAGFGDGVANATAQRSGNIILTRIDETDNYWVCSGTLGRGDLSGVVIMGGHKDLSDTLTQVRITTTSGAANFDNGSIGYAYVTGS